jgi:hypothetical protein
MEMVAEFKAAESRTAVGSNRQQCICSCRGESGRECSHQRAVNIKNVDLKHYGYIFLMKKTLNRMKMIAALHVDVIARGCQMLNIGINTTSRKMLFDLMRHITMGFVL